MRTLLVAIQFLTRVPITVEGVTERDVGRSAVFFPVVGALVGGALLGAYLLLALLLPPVVARMVTLLIWIMLAGAFHLDGLADTVDGLYGGKDREDALRIMKDPHVGAMGVIAIVSTLLVKAAALASLPEDVFRGAIVVTPVLGHAAMVLALALPYARPAGLGKAFAEHRSTLDVPFASVATLGAAFGLFKFAGLAALGVGLLCATVLVGMAWRKIRGVTGDVCGAVNELTETAALVSLTGLAVLPSWFWRWHL